MRIFLTGVSGVGKTTVGKKLGKLEKKLAPKEKKLYLKRIRKDINYFRASYKGANLQIDISGLNADPAAHKVKKAIEQHNRSLRAETIT